MDDNAWRVWNWRADCESSLFRRATSELPLMESTKQLAELVSEVYKPGMKVLDIGCATGHYLLGLMRVDPEIDYHGVDATRRFIEGAKQAHASRRNASFEIADIFDLPFTEPTFDIVFSCNVILHLPGFRVPVRNLMRPCKNYCFIRTLMSDRSYIVKRVRDEDFDEDFLPKRHVFQNTYSRNILRRFVESEGDFDVEFIEDKFDSRVIEKEFHEVKKGRGTQCVNGMQLDGNIVFEWGFMKLTRHSTKEGC